MSFRFSNILILNFFLATLILAGCSLSLGEGKNKSFSYETLTFRGQEFDLLHLNPQYADLRLFWKSDDGSALGNFANLQAHLKSKGLKLLFATNAGIFSDDLSPGGLHIEGRKELSPLNLNNGAGNFHLKPNGVFLLRKKEAKVVDSEDYANEPGNITVATQSGPLLTLKGEIHPAFTEGSENKYIRSGVGVSEDGHIHFAISKETVNFYDFASLFLEVLNCPNSLYLDGHISRFYLPESGLTETAGNFVGMFGVVEKE